MKRLTALLLALLTAASLTGCEKEPESAELSLFAMDTYMTLSAVGEGGGEVLAEISRSINVLEQQFSRTIESSDVSVLNREGRISPDTDMDTLLRLAVQYSEETAGAFDVTIAPLVALWGITSDSPRVPEQGEIDALLPLVGSQHIHRDADVITLDEGCAIDLGGIAKGYASDAAAAIFHQSGLTRGCANLGGNVYVFSDDAVDTCWNVGIQDPQDPSGWVCTLALDDHFVVTSGGYQRNFTAEDGTVYQHIIDPATGAPAESDLLSVSVIAAYSGDAYAGTRADAYSTALYVMGERAAADLWREKNDFDMVLVTTDGRVLYTPGLADCFTEAEDSCYVYQQIAA